MPRPPIIPLTTALLWLGLAACAAPAQDRTGAVAREEALAATNVWHAAKLRGVTFRAVGQEPGWLLEITKGQGILLVTDYGEQRFEWPYVEPRVDAEERRTEFILEAHDTVLEIRGVRCHDSMSGEAFEVTVTIRQHDRELQGCGRALY